MAWTVIKSNGIAFNFGLCVYLVSGHRAPLLKIVKIYEDNMRKVFTVR